VVLAIGLTLPVVLAAGLTLTVLTLVVVLSVNGMTILVVLAMGLSHFSGCFWFC
jgi:hypothetical protein